MNRIQAETTLVRRQGKLMAALGLSPAADGTNPDLTEPLARSMTRIGILLDDPTVVTAADVSGVPISQTSAMIDLAELYLLDVLQSVAASLVDVAVGERREQLSQIGKAIEVQLARKQTTFNKTYPKWSGSGVLKSGVIRLGFSSSANSRGDL